MASESIPPTILPAPPVPPAAAASPAPAYPPSRLFQAFRRCWRLASAVGLLAGGLVGALWWYSLPESYVAELRVRVPAPWTAGEAANDEEIGRYQRAQAALMQSSPVLEAVLARPDVARLPDVGREHDPLAWLGGRLAVGPSPTPDVLLLRVRANEPGEAALLARAVAEVYRDTVAGQRQLALRQTNEAAARTEEQLRQKRARLAQLENSRLGAAQKEAQQARFDLRVARAELEDHRRQAPDLERVVVPEQAVLAYLKDDPVGRQRLRDLDAAEDRIQTLIRVSALKERDPHLPEFTRQRDHARSLLDVRREEVRRLLAQNERQRAADKWRADGDALRRRVAFYEGLARSLDEEVRRLGGAAAEEERRGLRDEVAAGGETLRKLAAERERLENTPAPAEAGETVALQRRSRAGRVQTVALGAGGCCALLMLGVSWRELRLRRITAGSDIVAGLGLPVLGNIPGRHFRRALARPALDGGGPVAEAVDALRTVLLRDGGSGPRLLLVTSAVGGEGKTSLAALLAASLARAWRKTLLLDADLRKPEAHVLFDTPAEPGLSELLRGEAEAADVIHPTDVSRLWTIAAGHWDAHAIQALAQDGAGRLFDPLKEQFDFVVIDACPVLPVADALLICPHVDAVLLAVRSGQSRLPVVQAARQRLAAVSAPLRGAVLMGPDADLGGKSAVYPGGSR